MTHVIRLLCDTHTVGSRYFCIECRTCVRCDVWFLDFWAKWAQQQFCILFGSVSGDWHFHGHLNAIDRNPFLVIHASHSTRSTVKKNELKKNKTFTQCQYRYIWQGSTPQSSSDTPDWRLLPACAFRTQTTTTTKRRQFPCHASSGSNVDCQCLCFCTSMCVHLLWLNVSLYVRVRVCVFTRAILRCCFAFSMRTTWNSGII